MNESAAAVRPWLYPVVCAVPLTSQEMLDICTALIRSTETCLPEESADFTRRPLLMFKFDGGAVTF
jgi:hypothetical protein